MSHTQVETHLREHPNAVAVLAVGSTEQHGFGPCGTDHLIAKYLSHRVTEGVENTVLVPSIAYGMSKHHTWASGTISLPWELFQGLVANVLEELYRSGFRRVVIINGHGGNHEPIEMAIKSVRTFHKDLQVQNRLMIYVQVEEKYENPIREQMLELCAAVGQQELSHADAPEFSLLFAMFPTLQQYLDADLAEMPKLPDLSAVTGVRDPQEWKAKMAPCRGGKGDPREANLEVGAKVVQALVAQLVADATTGW
ncbi:MAG: creatininase family protein [Patescibacteria group bacterium]|jgi:creatinine amidohydrolase